MDPVISIVSIIGILIVAGAVIAIGRPGSIDWR